MDMVPPPGVFVSVDSKTLRNLLGPLESTLAGCPYLLIPKGLAVLRVAAFLSSGEDPGWCGPYPPGYPENREVTA